MLLLLRHEVAERSEVVGAGAFFFRLAQEERAAARLTKLEVGQRHRELATHRIDQVAGRIPGRFRTVTAVLFVVVGATRMSFIAFFYKVKV